MSLRASPQTGVAIRSLMAVWCYTNPPKKDSYSPPACFFSFDSSFLFVFPVVLLNPHQMCFHNTPACEHHTLQWRSWNLIYFCVRRHGESNLSLYPYKQPYSDDWKEYIHNIPFYSTLSIIFPGQGKRIATPVCALARNDILDFTGRKEPGGPRG